MRGRGFRVLLLVVIAVWFGVVVPLHPRGVIRLGGGMRAGAEGKACCRVGQQQPISSSSQTPDSKQRPGSGSECAVCHFVGTLDLPAGVGVGLAELGLVGEASVPVEVEAPVIGWGDSFCERGPPGV